MQYLNLVTNMIMGDLTKLPPKQAQYCGEACLTIRTCFSRMGTDATAARRLQASCHIVCGMYYVSDRAKVRTYISGTRPVCARVGLTLKDPE